MGKSRPAPPPPDYTEEKRALRLVTEKDYGDRASTYNQAVKDYNDQLSTFSGNKRMRCVLIRIVGLILNKVSSAEDTLGVPTLLVACII